MKARSEVARAGVAVGDGEVGVGSEPLVGPARLHDKLLPPGGEPNRLGVDQRERGRRAGQRHGLADGGLEGGARTAGGRRSRDQATPEREKRSGGRGRRSQSKGGTGQRGEYRNWRYSPSG